MGFFRREQDGLPYEALWHITPQGSVPLRFSRNYLAESAEKIYWFVRTHRDPDDPLAHEILTSLFPELATRWEELSYLDAAQVLEGRPRPFTGGYL